MKTPYNKLSIPRLENAVKNHTAKIKAIKKANKNLDPALINKQKLYYAEWQLKTAKKWLQKRTDERDMKNH